MKPRWFVKLPAFARVAVAMTAVGALAFGAGAARAEFVQTDTDNKPEDQTLLLADEISYNDDTNIVTATGSVEVQRSNRLLMADKIVYDRNADIATATGHVSLLDNTGTVFYFDSIQVTGDLKQGLADEVRVLLADKSRMASRVFRRLPTGVNELYEAVYTPCDSCKGEDPLWQIKASRVRYDRDAQMVYYNDAWLEIGGVPVFYTPYLAHPDPTSGAKSGLLLPAIGASRNLGAFYKQPYYIRIDDNRDATLTPFLTSDAGKGAIVQYRQNFADARVRVDGSLIGGDPDLNEDLRGHLTGTARWDLDEHWRTGTDLNFASDRTYLRRYAFEAPTWLTSNLFGERFSQSSYFSANAYYIQRQRAPVLSSSVPVIAPLLTYSLVSDPDALGGTWNVDANGLVLFRETGTDTNRLSARVGWSLPYTSSYGAVYTFRADMRGDGYYVRDVPRPTKGDVFTGTEGRFVPEASLEWRMPFVSDQVGFRQVLEPIAMIAVSPHRLNPESIPNEDSLDLEFDDTNLFNMDRFSGLDRVETGARVNYGVRWSAFNDTVGTVSAMMGQSYRFHDDPVFSPLSGLRGHLSDFVGHVDFTPSPYASFQYRFRIDKDTLASRRGEVSAGLGPELFRVGASYLFVKTDGPTATAFGSTEELFVSLSSRFSQHWSIAASHRQNLGRNGGAIRTQVGVAYEDECFIFGVDFANDNTSDRDFKRGVAVLLRIGLKTIGDIKFNTDIGARR
jgi:LPS-assembly protein